ncbi:hypothetical protein [[Eubacterium] cellulosolvens]
MKKRKVRKSYNEMAARATKEPPQKVSFGTKLVVIIVMVLILSSGPLYYIDVPLFYYGVLGLSVFIVLVIVFILMYFLKGQQSLFGGALESDKERVGGDRAEEIPNPGLEKVLKAEKRYRRLIEATENTNKGHKTIATESKKSKKHTGDESLRSLRIGSMPLAESTYKKRVRLNKGVPEKEREPSRSEKITTFICPDCGGKELYYEAGLISGYKYHCKDCDYIGTFVIEKDFEVD